MVAVLCIYFVSSAVKIKKFSIRTKYPTKCIHNTATILSAQKSTTRTSAAALSIRQNKFSSSTNYTIKYMVAVLCIYFVSSAVKIKKFSIRTKYPTKCIHNTATILSAQKSTTRSSTQAVCRVSNPSLAGVLPMVLVDQWSALCEAESNTQHNYLLQTHGN